MSSAVANRLINETSPYLLQHAYNPVNWYPWGEEALNRARKEDKPILVSIGYAACHWCHVMEKESFEDAATAAIMNQHFVNIKIDREERPDLDHIYMDAVQAISGSGGWPLNVFLTPDAKPFYGGTYFPPVEAHNRASWKNVLLSINQSFQNKRNEVESQAENLTNHLINANQFGIGSATADAANTIFTDSHVQTIADNVLAQADTILGGFGKAPKFPQTFSIQFLLRHYHFTGHQASLEQALLSLDKMLDGGIYDQIGGGLARYSTDNEWLAPHFEKMLYDNALFLNVLSEAYHISGIVRYKKAIQQTVAFVQRDLLSTQGAFYSALDADSEGEEGKFYVWSKREIAQILNEKQLQLFCEYFDVSDEGNWEHTNILRVVASAAQIAEKHGMTEIDLMDVLNNCQQLLLNERNKRIYPSLDDKILLGWNALMITALSKCYAATGLADYKQMAINAMNVITTCMKCVDGTAYWHTYKEGGIAKVGAFLDDYAYLIQAFIHLHEITGNCDYLLEAKRITEYTNNHFSEKDTSFYYFTNTKQNDIIVRKKEVYDGAIPSGNAVMAKNLLHLGLLFCRDDWYKRSREMIESLGKAIIRYPTSFGIWANVLQQHVVGTKEITIVGKLDTEDLKQLLSKYLPNKILLIADADNTNFELSKGKKIVDKTGFYLCEKQTCKPVVFSVQQFLTLIFQ